MVNMRKHAVNKTKRTGLYFVLPFFILFVILLIVPLLYSGYISLYRKGLVGGNRYVGLDNYSTMIHDSQWITSIEHVAIYFLIQVPVMLILAVFAALAIDSGKLRFPRFFRLAIFIPYAVPAIIGTVIWAYFYGTNYGFLNQLLGYIGIHHHINFLGSPLAALGSISALVTWEFAGYNMIILYAALQGLSTELYEAAAVDGAGSLKTALRIKLPQLYPAIFLTLIFSIIGSFQLFVEPLQFNILSPTVVNNYFTPNVYAYTSAFQGQQLNYAATISFSLGLVIAIVATIATLIGRRKGEQLI
jgi:multiple sugar transport system permease protein